MPWNMGMLSFQSVLVANSKFSRMFPLAQDPTETGKNSMETSDFYHVLSMIQLHFELTFNMIRPAQCSRPGEPALPHVGQPRSLLRFGAYTPEFSLSAGP